MDDDMEFQYITINHFNFSLQRSNLIYKDLSDWQFDKKMVVVRSFDFGSGLKASDTSLELFVDLDCSKSFKKA